MKESLASVSGTNKPPSTAESSVTPEELKEPLAFENGQGTVDGISGHLTGLQSDPGGKPCKIDDIDWNVDPESIRDRLEEVLASDPELLPDRSPSRDEEQAEGRPPIKIRRGRLAEATREAAAALGQATRANPFDGVYRYGDLLVQVTRRGRQG